MPKKKDWGASTRTSARLASQELSEEPEREGTATHTVREEDDLCPGAFHHDEYRVIALPSIEIADDSLIDFSSEDSGRRDACEVLVRYLAIIRDEVKITRGVESRRQTANTHLITENSEVSYEDFTRVLTATVLTRKEDYEHDRQKNLASAAKSPSPSRHRSERSERRKNRTAPAFDVKKLIGMTREEARNKGACYSCGLTGHLQAECPNKRAVIREFTARFEEEDEGDLRDHSQDLSKASSEYESGNDSDH